MSLIFSPLYKTLPKVGFTSPDKIESSVDFPAPFGPITDIISP